MAGAEGRGQGDLGGESGKVRFEGARVGWMQGLEGGRLGHRGQGGSWIGLNATNCLSY